MDLTPIWPTLAQIVGWLVGTGGVSAFVLGVINFRRDTRAGATSAAITEATARADIAKQLETERTTRQAAERERDEANDLAARAGRERDLADRRAEAADRRANTAQREADAWELHAAECREAFLNQHLPLELLPARPSRHH